METISLENYKKNKHARIECERIKKRIAEIEAHPNYPQKPQEHQAGPEAEMAKFFGEANEMHLRAWGKQFYLSLRIKLQKTP